MPNVTQNKVSIIVYLPKECYHMLEKERKTGQTKSAFYGAIIEKASGFSGV